jgi:hypothetical protein
MHTTGLVRQEDYEEWQLTGHLIHCFFEYQVREHRALVPESCSRFAVAYKTSSRIFSVVAHHCDLGRQISRTSTPIENFASPVR